MEATNLPTFLTFGNAKNQIFVGFFAKKIIVVATKLGGPGANLGVCPQPGPKPPLTIANLKP